MGFKLVVSFQILLGHLASSQVWYEGAFHVNHAWRLGLNGHINPVQNYQYPNQAPPTMRESWETETDPGHVIRLTCYDVRIPEASPEVCKKYGLEVIDGDKTEYFCGNVKNLSRLSKTHTFRMYLWTGPNGGGIVNCTLQGQRMENGVPVTEPPPPPPTTTPPQHATRPPPPPPTTPPPPTFLMQETVEMDSSEHGGPPGRLQPTCDCGRANRGSERIVGGEEAQQNKYPFMVYLTQTWDYERRHPMCGASIITEYHALSAAHCTSKFVRMGAPLSIVVNWHDWTRLPPDSHVYNIKQIIEHEQYKDGSPWPNDIALLALERRIDLGPNIGKVCLPNRPVNLDHQPVRAIGWGNTKWRGTQSYVLKETYLRIVPKHECHIHYNEINTNSTKICVWGRNTGTCQGDSGGPVLWLNPATNRYTIIGVTSYGRVCASRDPSVKTEVASFTNWLEKHIKATEPKATTCYVRD